MSIVIKLIKGDCLDKMKDIADGSIDAVITDIPYGTTACKWDTAIPFEPMWNQLKRITKKNGAIVLFGSQPFTSALVMSNIKMFKYEWIWDKMKGSGSLLAKKRPLKSHENILIFCKTNTIYIPQKEISKVENRRDFNRRNRKEIKKIKSDIYGTVPGYIDVDVFDLLRHPKTIIQISSQANELNQGKRLHPTQKPVSLIEYLIKTYTNEGETVLDFTSGSFTTAIACLNTKRNFIGIEKDEHYFQIGKERINKHIKTLDYTPEIREE